MPIIKRYPNRKLYDTQAKRYITLEGIADLVRQGHEVHVRDNATGEDLTAVTLTQIMFEQEKKEGGLLPRSVLSELVKAGGNTLSALQHALASPLGLSGQVDEEIGRRIQALVGRGEMTPGEGDHLREMLTSEHARPADGKGPDESAWQRALGDHAVPTKSDVQRLINQVRALEKKLDEIGGTRKRAASPKRVAADKEQRPKKSPARVGRGRAAKE